MSITCVRKLLIAIVFCLGSSWAISSFAEPGNEIKAPVQLQTNIAPTQVDKGDKQGTDTCTECREMYNSTVQQEKVDTKTTVTKEGANVTTFEEKKQ